MTNDDGIRAPGLEALYDAVADLGHVDVVAPAAAESATGHAISINKPLLVKHLHVNNRFDGRSVAGRPADCVKLAVLELLEEPPDLVLSGINAGANTGVNVLYSGTVAGAMEGALQGISSVAFSLELSEELDFGRAGQVARRVLEAYLEAPPAPGSCLSVNIPATGGTWPRGIRCCPQAPVSWEEHYRKEVNADGDAVYWLDGRLPDLSAAPDTDMAVLRAGYVSVTPLRGDMTDRTKLNPLAARNWPDTFA